MSPVFTAVAGLAAFLLLLAGCGSDKGVAARVNGKPLQIREVEEMIQRYATLSRKLDPAYTAPTGMVLENMRKQFLDGLIDKSLILSEAVRLNVTVSDSELTAKITSLKKTNEVMDEESFNRYLKEQGISEAEFRNNIRDIMLMEKTRDKLFAETTVADSEAQAWYLAHAGEFARETMRAAHILVQVPSGSTDTLPAFRKAEAAAMAAKKGGDFSALAKKYSDDPGAANGGDLGEFGRGDMLPEIDQVVFTLKMNEAAGPVKSRLGYHVVKALADPKRSALSYETVSDKVKSRLLVEKRKAKLLELRNHGKIKILWDFKTVS